MREPLCRPEKSDCSIVARLKNETDAWRDGFDTATLTYRTLRGQEPIECGTDEEGVSRLKNVLGEKLANLTGAIVTRHDGNLKATLEYARDEHDVEEEEIAD